MGCIRDEVDRQIYAVLSKLKTLYDKIEKYVSNFYIDLLKILFLGFISKIILIIISKYFKVFTPSLLTPILDIIIISIMSCNFIFFISQIIKSIRELLGDNEDLKIKFSIKNI